MNNNGQEIASGERGSHDNGTSVARRDFLKTSVLASTGILTASRLLFAIEWSSL